MWHLSSRVARHAPVAGESGPTPASATEGAAASQPHLPRALPRATNHPATLALALAVSVLGCGYIELFPNAPVVSGSIPDQTVFVGESVRVSLASGFSDPDGDAMSYSAASFAPRVASVTVAGSDVAVTGVSAGTASVTVTAKDPGGLSARQTFGVTVPNRPPVPASGIPDRTVPAGDAVSLDLGGHFSDPDGDALSYAAESSAPDVAAAAVSGASLTITAVSGGAASVTVTARDPGGLSARQTLEVTVPNRAPVAASGIPDRTVPAGDAVSLDLAGHFSDPDGDALSYAAESSAPEVAAAAVAGASLTITAVSGGTATMTVTARDPGGLSARQTFEVTVPNRAPVAASGIPDRTVPAGDAVSLDLAGHFSDPDGDALSYAAASSAPDVAAAAVSGASLTITAVSGGTATMTVTASDPGGLSARQTFGVTVPNRAPVAVSGIPDRTVPAGDAVSLDLAGHFRDPDGDALSYAAASSAPDVAAAAVSGASLTITAVSGGTATMTVTASDPGGLSARQTFGVTVPNRAPVAVSGIPDRTVPPGGAVSLDLTGHFSDPDGDALTYAAGSSAPGVARAAVSGASLTITAVSGGTATMTVTASDPGGLSARQTFEVTVTVTTNRAPVAVSGIPDRTVPPGGAVSLDLTGHFSDPDGDALTYAAGSSAPGVARAAVSGASLTITAVSGGTATMTVTASDPGGLSARQTFEVTVTVTTNRAPVAVSGIPDRTVPPGGAVSLDLTGHFSDPDGDALTYAAGSSAPGVARAAVSGASLTITAVSGGTATMTVTASDPGGLSARQTFQVTVTVTTNRAPVPASGIPDQFVGSGESKTVSLASSFSDPDGDALSYAASSSAPGVARAAVSGASLTITAVSGGTASVTVTASDPGGLSAHQTFEVSVRASPAPSTVYLAQAVQQRGSPVPLVAGEPALLRVFVTARSAGTANIPPVRARFFRGGALTHVVDIPQGSVPIPTAVDESALEKSANVKIPASVVQPGLQMVIEIDPDGTLDPALGVARRIPETGRLAVDVRAMPTLALTLVPFVFDQDLDSTSVDLAREVAADPEHHQLLRDTRALLPVGGLDVDARGPVLTSTIDAVGLLVQMRAIRFMEGGTGHYMGLTKRMSGARGIAYISAWEGVSMLDTKVVAHELGHNMSLLHAPACNAPGADPAFPNPYGTINAWGYDFRNGVELVPPHTPDLMGYCATRWISPYHFGNMLRYRQLFPGRAAPTTAAARDGTILVWGGVDDVGRPFLEPAFLVDAPPVLPRLGGEYRITGRTEAGDVLFSFAFDMPEVAHGNGGSAFAFAVPAQPEWVEALSSIALIGPGGSATLDRNTNRPTVILRDPLTGHVRGILRNRPSVAFARGNLPAPLRGLDLDVLFSQGIPRDRPTRR